MLSSRIRETVGRDSRVQTCIFTIENQKTNAHVSAESLQARIPQLGVLSQASSARNPQRAVLSKIPHPGFLSQQSPNQEPPARIPQLGVLSQDSSAISPQQRFLSQDFSARSLQPNLFGVHVGVIVDLYILQLLHMPHDICMMLITYHVPGPSRGGVTSPRMQLRCFPQTQSWLLLLRARGGQRPSNPTAAVGAGSPPPSQNCTAAAGVGVEPLQAKTVFKCIVAGQTASCGGESPPPAKCSNAAARGV